VPTRDAFTRLLAIVDHGTPVPELDLLIRTGGERRLSDFLLWEAAYAELLFVERMWPDFDVEDLAGAVREFESRERRYGGLRQAAAGASRRVGG
jgi:undecaprenyl diphosphate synthase